MNPSVRLLFAIPTLRLAGAERQVVELVRALDNERYEVGLVTFGDDLAQLEDLREHLTYHVNLVKRRRWDLGLTWQLRAVIAERRPHIVICTLNFASLLGALATRMVAPRPAFVPALHTTAPRDRQEAVLQRFIYAPLLRRAHAAVSVSSSQRTFLVERYGFSPHRLHVIRNGISLDRLASSVSVAGKRVELGIPADAKVIGVLAGLRPEKGHEYLLRAVARLRNESPVPFVVLLVGDGVRRAYLESLSAELGVSDVVQFLGFRQDVGELAATFDMTVLSSYAVETLSMALLETMAAGVPAVVTDVGGLGEVVRNGQEGVVVPVRDSDALADAMRRLLEDEVVAAQMGAAAQARICNEFTAQVMARKWDALFRMVIDGTARGPR